MSAIEDLRLLAGEIHRKRPDWDFAGILTHLAKHRNRGTLNDLRAAAFKATRNRFATTPAAIGFDASWTSEPETTAHIGSEPLPECSACHLPVARRDAERLEECPNCAKSWVPNMLEAVDVEEQMALGEHAPARLGKARFADVRARMTRRIPTPDDPDLLKRTCAVACPWCQAKPGVGCTVPGSGRDVINPKTKKVIGRDPDRPLTHATAHPARHTAAGSGPVRIDQGWFQRRRTPRLLMAAAVPAPGQDQTDHLDPDLDPDSDDEEPERERYP